MKIRQKIVLSLLCIALPALLAVGAFGYWQAAIAIELAERLSLDALAAGRRDQLVNLIRDWREATENMSGERLLVGTLEEFNRKPYTRFKRRLSRIMARSTSTESVAWAQIIDLQQKVVAQSGQRVLGDSKSNNRYDMKRGGFQVLRISHVESSGVPVALLQQPIVVKQEPIGFLVVERRVRGLVDVVNNEHGLGQTGQVSLVWNGADSGVVANSRPSDAPPVLLQSADEETLTTLRVLPTGNVLMSSRVVKNVGLSVTVTLDEDEYLQPIRELGTALVGFCAIIVIFVLVAGLWIGGHLTKGVRHLSDIAAQIGDGKLNVRARVTGNDEVAVLGRSFNVMTEALVTANETLERRVEARTQELAASHTQLEARNTELSRSNRDLAEFASVASHDLQEPLRKIQAFGGRLSDRYSGQLDERGQDYIRRMQHSATRMRTLIEDLLTFSRIQSKAQPFAEVDLNQTVQTVLSDFDLRLQDTHGQIECDELPAIQADAFQMYQLFQNLIGNALKYAKDDVPPVIRITNLSDSQELVVQVKDNGIGFSSHHSDRIFGIFQRLHGREVYDGTGVGLAICKRIVERHHGEITCTAEVGVGATFTVRLPRKQTLPDESGSSQAIGEV